MPQKKELNLTLQQRIELLAELGRYLKTNLDDPALQQVIHQSWMENKWFVKENTEQALLAIAHQMLDESLLQQWAAHYALHSSNHPEKNIGIVMAGNIPLVGFHDWLCVFVAGERARVKLSTKDRLLLPFLVQLMGQWEPISREYTYFCSEQEPLKGFDAVIATGSNNTARYFEQYFAAYPHIIRQNRNSVAILNGSETTEDFRELGKDIFSYFGLGCRNVSKLYVPNGYSFDSLLETLHEYRELANHDKYRNNFDYNMTLFLLNNLPFLHNGCLILRAEESIPARIASVHYSSYENETELVQELLSHQDQIQCVIGKKQIGPVSVIHFGQSQAPTLSDYPDGVDVMAWLTNLNRQ